MSYSAHCKNLTSPSPVVIRVNNVNAVVFSPDQQISTLNRVPDVDGRVCGGGVTSSAIQPSTSGTCVAELDIRTVKAVDIGLPSLNIR